MSIKETLIQPCWLLSSEDDYEQEFALLLSSPEKLVKAVAIGKQYLDRENLVIISENQLSETTVEVIFSTRAMNAWTLFQSVLCISEKEGFDVAVLPIENRSKKLLVCDMDSTIVASETLDDVAAKIGIGAQVKDITDRAMRGELDFKQALDERVGLLKGLPEMVFHEIANEVVLNPGAEKLIKSANDNGIKTVLVSGGFEPIVKVVAEQLGFDRYVCNALEINEDKLTGKVVEPIVDASTKLNVLQEECQNLNIELREACTIGDGANDLPMLQAAGLGIVYCGKPLLRSCMSYQINSIDLTLPVFWMGIN